MICGDIVKANLDSLLNAARAVDESGNNITEYWKADIAFHRSLVELSNCRLIIDTYIKSINVPAFYNINSFFMNYDPEKRENHISLVTLLSECKPDEAETAVRKHLNSGKSHTTV